MNGGFPNLPEKMAEARELESSLIKPCRIDFQQFFGLACLQSVEQRSIDVFYFLNVFIGVELSL